MGISLKKAIPLGRIAGERGESVTELMLNESNLLETVVWF